MIRLIISQKKCTKCAMTMCYDIKDIVEEEETQEYLSEKADLLGRVCDQRGIKLWEGMNEK